MWAWCTLKYNYWWMLEYNYCCMILLCAPHDITNIQIWKYNKIQETPYSNHIAYKQDASNHLISYHHHLFNRAILEGIKDLWAREVLRGGTLYLRPDGNSWYLTYRRCDTSARIACLFPATQDSQSSVMLLCFWPTVLLDVLKSYWVWSN